MHEHRRQHDQPPDAILYARTSTHEQAQAHILAECGLKSGAESFAVERLVQAVVAADHMGPQAREEQLRGLAGGSSDGRRRLGQVKFAMFQLALQSYERSSACVRGRRLSGMQVM